MTKTQEELFYILKVFDKICRRHDIEYFLTGGSALGAIRHNGFIPWDDDIDIGVTRETWSQLKPILMKELQGGIVLVDKDEYPNYLNPIIRIVNTNSARITRASLADGCPKGQFLEIFIHDYVPKEKAKEQLITLITYSELLNTHLSTLQQTFRLKKGLLDEEIAVIDKYFRIKKEYNDDELKKLLSNMEKSLYRYDRAESDYMLLGWGANALQYPLENYDGVRYEMFEGLEVPVSVRACDNLRIDYRNEWTNYPPKGAQKAPHLSVGVQGISGEEYMTLIREEVSFEATNAMRLSLKEVNLKALKERMVRDKQMINIKMRFAKEVEKHAGDIRLLYISGKYEEITERFNEYIKTKKSILNYTFDEDIRVKQRK